MNGSPLSESLGDSRWDIKCVDFRSVAATGGLN